MVTVAPLRERIGDGVGIGAEHRSHAGRGHDQRQRPRYRGAAADEPDAGDRERRRRQPGVGRTGGRAGDPRPRARPHADSDRRRARQLRAARRSERDVSRSDRSIEGVDVARGPGLGRVRIRRVRRRDLGAHAPRRSRLAAVGAVQRHRWRGRSRKSAAPFEVSKGLAEGGVLFAAHTRDADDWDSPVGRGVQLRLQRSRLPRPRSSTQPAPARSRRRLAERLRPRHRAAAQQLAHGALLLSRPRTRIASRPATKPTTSAASSGSASPGSSARYDQRTDQDRFATATTGRTIERADISAKDFHVRGFGERLFGKARLELGVDVNGRFDLHAIDDLITYDLAGDVDQHAAERLGRYGAPHRHRRLRVDRHRGGADRSSLGAGIRGDYVTTQNAAATSATARPATAPAPATRRPRVGSFGGRQRHRRRSRAASAIRCCPIATIADRPAAASSPAIPISIRRPACSTTSRVRYTAPAFRVAAFYYHYEIDDLIERYSTATDFFFFRNRGDGARARVRGRRPGDCSRPGSRSISPRRSPRAARSTTTPISTTSRRSTSRRRCASSSASARSAQLRAAYFSDDDHFGPTERAVPGYTMLDAGGRLPHRQAARAARPGAQPARTRSYFASQDVRTDPRARPLGVADGERQVLEVDCAPQIVTGFSMMKMLFSVSWIVTSIV